MHLGIRTVAKITAVAGLVTAMLSIADVAHAQDSVRVPGDIAAAQCPAGFQYSRGIEVNVTTHEQFTICYAEPNAAELALRAQDEDFRARIQAAENAALLESQKWNAEHPGEQRCVEWGPIVHANGVSTSSGGVCANPVVLDQVVAVVAPVAPPSGAPIVQMTTSWRHAVRGMIAL